MASNCWRLSRISCSSSMIRIEPLADINRFPCAGEFQEEGGTVSEGAFHANLSGVLADDAVGHSQPEPGAAAGGFGSEEGVEYLVQVIGGDAHTVIRNFHVDGRILSLGGQRQLASSRHGIARIHNEVH